MLGAVFALMAAGAFAVNSVLIRRSVAITTPSHVAFITVIMGVPMFAIAALVTGQLFRFQDLPVSGYAYLGLGGVINFIAGRQFNYMAIEALGAARAAPFQALTLPYSVLIAYLFLDEGVSVAMGVGVGLIMIGPAIMVERPSRQRVAVAASVGGPDAAPAFVPRQVEGYIAATLAAVAYGTSPILFRAALEGQTDLSALSGLVSYVAASVLLLASALLPGRRYLLRALEPGRFRLFFGASASVFAADAAVPGAFAGAGSSRDGAGADEQRADAGTVVPHEPHAGADNNAGGYRGVYLGAGYADPGCGHRLTGNAGRLGEVLSEGMDVRSEWVGPGRTKGARI